ncbi:synaptogenesis syg-2-like [Octopus vulgaris]|uniref:Synaptogenesis syg-2-like n=1 Tax=Octopus vulgaris TaxID=6645 RepID=A0AA36FE17_OCTVU|nr:synaptogenesis syg-2-like [Octopus vulgaris]
MLLGESYKSNWLKGLRYVVKCRGIHIAANVSHEKNLTIYYPPKTIEIKTDEPFLEGRKGILHCKAINGYPEKYSYRWDPSNKTSQNLTLSQLNRTHNNEVYTCYASNKCSKRELHKKHWINVEYPPDITAPENVTLFEDQASIINCSAKGNPTPEVWLEDKNRNFLSNSILTFNRKNISDVFCTAIAKSERNGNLTAKKEINILFKYPPQVNIHISNEPNNTKNTYNKEVLPINNPSFNNTGTWECHVINDDFRVIKSSNYKIPVKAMFSSVSNGPKKKMFQMRKL